MRQIPSLNRHLGRTKGTTKIFLSPRNMENYSKSEKFERFLSAFARLASASLVSVWLPTVLDVVEASPALPGVRVRWLSLPSAAGGGRFDDG